MIALHYTDYVIYDRQKDHVICFDSDGYITVYGCKFEAEMDRQGDEEVISCTDLPKHQRERLVKQITKHFQILRNTIKASKL